MPIYTKRSMPVKRLLGILLASSIYLTTALAQTDSARLVGSVTDATGAVLPGATVTAKNERTGEERSATANDLGFYILTNLRPASYTVSAKTGNLGPTQNSGIALSVGQERTLNLILQPQGVAQEVTVSGGELAAIDTSSARIGVNVSEREVAELPLNGRQVSQLYLLTPGAVNYGGGSFDDIRFSGRSNEQNAIRFDGVENSAIVDTNPGNLNGETTSQFRLMSSLENVQEFRVESNNYAAEFGTGTGGQISVVTKSGSNAFHGGLFEYFRNDALDARNFFDAQNPSVLRLNQYGGSLGGPIQKDKFFFFASLEALRQRTSSPIVETTLSAAARARAVTAVRPLLNAFPVGQVRTANPDFDLVTVDGPNKVDEYYGSLRFDYNFNERFRLSARYFRDQGWGSQTQNSTLSQFVQSINPQNGVLSLNQVLTPTVINETKFGFNGAKTRVNGVPGPSPDADLNGATINLSGSVSLAGIAGQAGSAGIATPTGLIRLSSSFNGRGAPYTPYSLSFIDSLSIVHQSHSLKFGVEVRPITIYNDQQGGTTYTFSNVNSFLNNQPSQIQFLGDLSAKSPFTGLTTNAHLRQNYYIGYAQDEWRIRPNLTLNYGLRYEYYSVLHDVNNKNVFFDMNLGTILPGTSKDWYNSSKLNFSPRLGLSWSPERFNGRTVLRIGGGIFYGPGQTEDQLQPSANDRLSRTITSGSLLAYPLNVPALVAAYDINDPSLGYQPRAYAPGYQIPEKIYSYTASVQQQLPGSAVLTVAYVGSQGRNLFLRSITNKIIGVSMNPANGNAVVSREFGNRFAEVDYKTSGGTSHYNALQTALNRRFSKGLTLGAQYTWAHDIGNTGGANEARTAANNYSFAADYGNNTFDVRQSFNASALYELPFGKGRKYLTNMNAFGNALAGGWELGGIMNARTGTPVEVLITRPDIVYRDSRNGTFVNSPIANPAGGFFTTPVVNVPGGGASRNIRRPDVVAGVDPYLHTNNPTDWVNPAAFAIPAPGTFGNLGRDALHGPGIAQLDLTLSKRFYMTEKINLEFRSEIYNLLNHAIFQAPGGGIVRLTNALGTGSNQLQPGQAFSQAAAGGTFGQINSTVSNQVGLGTNRQIQFSLRLNF